MENCEPKPDGEWHVIAAVHHLVKALESTKNLNDDMRRFLADFDLHLSTMTGLNENTREIEEKLISSQRTIITLHSNHPKIWDSSPLIVLEYLHTVEEIQSLRRSLENMPLNKSRKNKQLLDLAHTLLQMAMARLQNELIDILAQNKQCFEQESVSPPACEETPVYDESIVSNEDDSVENAFQRESSSSTETDGYVMDLIHPDVIPQIKSIATTMFASGYDHEFCQAFIGFWRDTLAEYLTIFDMEHFSIEEVLQMEWTFLNSKIRKWRRAIRGIIGIYLASAKRLFNQVLGEHGDVISSTCLMEASKGPLLCLLNFGQAVLIGAHRPEWLYCLLDMHEVLISLALDIDALFPQEIGSMVRVEFYELLTRVGDSTRAIFTNLGNHIASCSSTTPYANGGIHPLTKYVINYILCFAEYGDTSNYFFKLKTLVGKVSLVQWIRSNSKISTYFGDDWIRAHVGKFRLHATCYERVTWSSILPLLHDDGKVGKATLKARCRAFASAFEDVYKNQTRWCVPDIQLREELRISASKTVIHAYRNFVSKITNNIDEKHIKYNEQDLETYILDLLEGSSKSLRKR
ncbi:hypothetical protein BUALT_Bualt07G0074300 [Buddleja alternifolia]|uniref:Exocyst subunit Exo70 family protein n=1 Tax=Buddleja alternifolia TaxID=168488 RepID=A0AAV6XFI1_9LAMI|nr:hypothetical protein BUALT_Bualt07G0074300 [Buddleja alternifolia]